MSTMTLLKRCKPPLRELQRLAVSKVIEVEEVGVEEAAEEERKRVDSVAIVGGIIDLCQWAFLMGRGKG